MVVLSRYKQLVVGILFFFMTSVFALAGPKQGGDYVYPTPQFPPHFNSAIKSGDAVAFPASNIFVSLVTISEDWQPEPYLAKSWEVSPDGLTYTFHLFEGTVFHDNTPVTSKDVAFSLGVSKKNHPFGPYMFGAVDHVETPDKYTAVIKLSKPHPALLVALSLPLMPILPEHVYGPHAGPIRKNPANIHAIGSGPFKVQKYVAGKSFILERNDKFKILRSGRPYLDRIIGRKVNGNSAALIALKSGEIDSFFTADPQIIAKMQKYDSVKVISRGMSGVGSVDFIEFNLRKKYVKDVRVRQAIAYAIDREFITKRLHRGYTNVATGPIPSGSPFYSKDVNMYRFNIEKANQILDDAGYKRGSNGMRFELNLIYMPAFDHAQKMVAEYMKPMLKKIGIKINLKAPADFMNWYTTLAKWEHDISTSNVFMWGDPVIGTHRLFMSSNIRHQVWTNTCGYISKEVDQILNAAAVETDLDNRKQLYAKFQKVISEDLPYYFTIEDTLSVGYSKNLMDIPIGIWGYRPWDGVYLKNIN